MGGVGFVEIPRFWQEQSAEYDARILHTSSSENQLSGSVNVDIVGNYIWFDLYTYYQRLSAK